MDDDQKAGDAGRVVIDQAENVVGMSKGCSLVE
jgi:hypothetical protein